MGSGRPTGTTVSEGYSVSPGRPSGTIISGGYSVSHGRPTETCASEGYRVGTKGEKHPGAKGYSAFLEDLHLPTGWGTSSRNINSDILDVCPARIKQQRTFDKKSLGVGVCYGYGQVLWTMHSRWFPHFPSGQNTKNDAPAAAYFIAVPDCSLYFEHSSSTK